MLLLPDVLFRETSSPHSPWPQNRGRNSNTKTNSFHFCRFSYLPLHLLTLLLFKEKRSEIKQSTNRWTSVWATSTRSSSPPSPRKGFQWEQLLSFLLAHPQGIPRISECLRSCENASETGRKKKSRGYFSVFPRRKSRKVVLSLFWYNGKK